jgi:glyoxylase-like metal-dependent hydrolase (beta-lactamase superfamily II)
MEVAPGIHRIEARFAGRYLFQHVLCGDYRMLLVDSGVSDTPEEVIFPYLESIGRYPSAVDYVLCTHPDADHIGGNAQVLRQAPTCLVLAHELDVRWIEDPDAMVAERYDGFRADDGIGDPPEALAESRALCGEPTPVDIALTGGEWISLSEDWRVQVLHTPGHSQGHLSVWDPRSGTLIIADAAMGAALPFVDGSPALAPTYTHPGPYAATSAALATWPAQRLLTAHFPAFEGDAIAAHLDATAHRVREIEATLLEALDGADGPLGLRELIDAVDGRCGPLPEATRDTWGPPVHGHLEELETRGRIVARRDGGRRVWASAQEVRSHAA